MTLANLRDALLEIGVPVFHYSAHKKTDQYIVWAEDGEGNSGHGDNKTVTQVIQGTIDFFTKSEFDSVAEQVQDKLNSIQIAWKLNSVQHEEETGYIHYEWVWEMV